MKKIVEEIQKELVNINNELASVKNDVDYSFTDPIEWSREMSLLKGKLIGLQTSLNIINKQP